MKGKALSWKYMLKKETFVELYADYGNTFDLDPTTLSLEEYVCQLYGCKGQNLNATRC